MIKYLITSRTDNGIFVTIKLNGKIDHIQLNKKYEVFSSDEITDSMETYSKLGVISFTQVEDDDDKSQSVVTGNRRGRKPKNELEIVSNENDQSNSHEDKEE